MVSRFGLGLFPAIILAITLTLGFSFPGETAQRNAHHGAAVTHRDIDETKLAVLEGNTRPEANLENDRGPVPGDFPIEHMLLQLKRSPELESALEGYIAQLYDPASPNFHRWLSAQQFGEMYGLGEEDLHIVTSWLESHGFQVNVVYPAGMVIDFSGTARQLREAFHTEIHFLNIDGKKHFANMSDPRIPAALAPYVVGIVSLHDFMPRPMHRPRSQYTFASSSGTEYAVVPADLATIYNLNPLFSEGYSGQG
jgi:hypothetical protein